MAIPEDIYSNGYRYKAVDDRVITRFALLAGWVSDELHPANPLPQKVSVQVHDPAFNQALTSDNRQPGVFCLTGEPALVFPQHPQQPPQTYSLTLTLTVPGYQAVQVGPFLIDANTVFPVQVGNITLQAQPVSIEGRVTDLNGKGLVHSPVQITGSSNPHNGPAGHAVALRTPLQSNWGINTPVQTVELANNAAPLTLTGTAQQGSLTLALDQRAGLAVGQVIQVGAPEAGALYRITGLNGPADLAQPGTVALNAPLHRQFGAGTVVQPVTVGNTNPLAQLIEPAQAGDSLLMLDAPAAWIAEPKVLQVGNGAAAEIHLPGVVTDANGYYRLAGIRRVHTVIIEAECDGQTLANPLPVRVDYGTAVNRVNLRLA